MGAETRPHPFSSQVAVFARRRLVLLLPLGGADLARRDEDVSGLTSLSSAAVMTLYLLSPQEVADLSCPFRCELHYFAANRLTLLATALSTTADRYGGLSGMAL
mmetsp:Transcript_46857/g.141947  ORF Transcript_46857/g.141947 Transcript_46857/m.141947 type:complete len:104 (+) Transcript_46857:825-1136(+)